MAPSRKQPARCPQKEIQTFCVGIKKRLDSESKLIDDFLKFIDRYNQNAETTPTAIPQQFFSLNDFDFANLDAPTTVITTTENVV